jgi:hypothetical protein
MNNLATIEPEPKPAKKREVSRRVRHAVDLIVNGECKTQKAAAEKAGLTPERLCRALKESHVLEYLDQQTRVLLAQSRAPAAATLMTLLEQGKSEHVRKDVATTLLGYSGFHANGARGPLINLNIGCAPGYIIDLSRPGQQQDNPGGLSSIGGVIYGHEQPALIDVTPGAAEHPSAQHKRVREDIER